MAIPAFLAANPQLSLTGASMLARIGQGIFAGRDAKRAQRTNDERIAHANLANTFGARVAPSLVEATPGRATSLLGALGTGLEGASALMGAHKADQLAGVAREQAAEDRLRKIVAEEDAETARRQTFGRLLDRDAAQDAFRQSQLDISQQQADTATDNAASMKALRAAQAGALAAKGPTTKGALTANQKIGQATDAAQVTALRGKMADLQEMFQEAVARNLTGLEASAHLRADSKTLLGSLAGAFSADPVNPKFKHLANDELLTRINNSSESLIPIIRKASGEVGVMTEKDEARIRSQLPDISGINDTRELAKMPRLMDEMDAFIQAQQSKLGEIGGDVNVLPSPGQTAGQATRAGTPEVRNPIEAMTMEELLEAKRRLEQGGG